MHNKTDWPIYRGHKEFTELRFVGNTKYTKYTTEGVYWLCAHLPKTFVRIENPNWKIWGDKEFLYGYILKDEGGMIEQNPDTFRKAPVPGIRKWRNRVRPKQRHGLMRERKQDEAYGRIKRKVHIDWKYECWYDTEYYYFDNAKERSWKRTKKRKQWM